ncbi:MAG: 30S ribosomal protein S14 [Ignavibacteria bacterium]|jgi:small subunit ribosomal protein S14|nr:30S ribosomal protein S14 [Ignavibacteria bacterium]
MSKLSVIARNEKRKRLVEKYAKKREELRLAGDWEALQLLPRNSAPTRVRNRCTITGKGKGVYRKFGICRNQFRQLALEGKIPGVRKASW